MTSGVSLIYSTAPSEDIATSIAHTLLAEQSIACSNILPKMKSIYKWQGQVESQDEVVMILKTRTALVQKVMDRVRELHPYEVPCLLEISIPSGSKDYLQWLIDSTTGAP